MRDLLGAVQKAAAAYDRSALSLASIGNRLWEAGLAAAKTSSMRDAEYARIEALRQDPERPGGPTVFLSTEKGLGLPESAYQYNLIERNTPIWACIGLALTRVRLKRGADYFAWWAQRAQRGWATSDAWNADRHLAAVAAGMLAWIVEEGQTWPGESAEYPTIDQWQTTVRRHAKSLSDYSKENPEYNALLETWHALATDPETAGSPEEQEALERVREIETQQLEDAKSAMRWIADHLGQLWD